MMRFRYTIVLLLTEMTVAGIAAQATTLARMSLEQLAAANDVARVRCVASRTERKADGIWTLTKFYVLRTMKGTLPTQITVRLPGGHIGHLTAAVDGVPRFSPGEEAVVFLQGSPAGGFTVAGWIEGTFRIDRGPAGRASVTQDSSAFAVFDPASRSFRLEGIHRMPLEQFQKRLAAAIARARNDGGK
jgi:hypothetical protein